MHGANKFSNTFLSYSLLILLLGIVAYSNSFTNSFHFDDFPYIVENPAIRDISRLDIIWQVNPTRFFTYLTFALNYALNGLNVIGYHILSFIFHCASAVLVMRLTKILLKSDKQACCAALLFLLHPIQTEPVNFILQRAVLMATFFYLLALILYIRSRQIFLNTPHGCVWVYYLLGAVISASVGMFSKETAMSLPLVIILIEAIIFRGEKFSWKIFFPVVATGVLIPLTWMISNKANVFNLHQSVEGAVSGGITTSQYALTQLKVVIEYIKLILFPYNQSVSHEIPLANSFNELPVIISAGLIVGILFIAIYLKKIFPIITFSIVFFFITLLPESSIIPITNVMCEYRLHLPMVGFSIFLTGAVFQLFRFNESLAKRLLIILLVVFGFLTYQRNRIWKDEFTLWNNAVQNSPTSQRAYLNRGTEYHRRGDLDKAMADYNMVIGLGPVTAVTLSNRGSIFRTKKQYDLALANFNLAIQINSSYIGTYINRGLLYVELGEKDLAINDFTKAYQLAPQNLEIKNYLKVLTSK